MMSIDNQEFIDVTYEATETSWKNELIASLLLGITSIKALNNHQAHLLAVSTQAIRWITLSHKLDIE